MNADVPFGLLVEPEQFAPFLDDPKFRIVDLSRESVFEQLHLPNAISVRPSELVRHQEFASGLLPETEKLQTLFDRLGITANHHVIVYDDEGGICTVRGFIKPVYSMAAFTHGLPQDYRPRLINIK